MRTFRAIQHAEALRERQIHIEDHSSNEHLLACRIPGSAIDWRLACFRNYPHMPCPGHLWSIQ